MPGVLVRHRGRRGKILGVQIVVLEPYNGGRGASPKFLGIHGPLPRPLSDQTVPNSQ